MADSSTLIVLAKVDRLSVLADQASEVLIPGAVVREIGAGDERDSARLAIAAGFGVRVEPPLPIPDSVLEWGLGSGESAVIAVALHESNCLPILDDRLARKCARAHGLQLLGTIGLVVRARVRGLIPSARALIEDLRAAGLFVDDTVVESVLKSIGEG